MKRESLCPPGHVELRCDCCGWCFWLPRDDYRVFWGPRLCPSCQGDDGGEKNE